MLEGGWLSDTIISAGQHLLRKQYPDVGSLQPPTLGETLTFDVQRRDFVQILRVAHIGSQFPNWLSSSTCDSFPNCELYSRTKQQIAAILFSTERSFLDESGGTDCGLFSLAFAASLCAGENPSEIYYIKRAFRDHLNSFWSNKIAPFP